MFEIAVVNEPSVFKPLKFYCTVQFSSADFTSLFNAMLTYFR